MFIGPSASPTQSPTIYREPSISPTHSPSQEIQCLQLEIQFDEFPGDISFDIVDRNEDIILLSSTSQEMGNFGKNGYFISQCIDIIWPFLSLFPFFLPSY